MSVTIPIESACLLLFIWRLNEYRLIVPSSQFWKEGKSVALVCVLPVYEIDIGHENEPNVFICATTECAVVCHRKRNEGDISVLPSCPCIGCSLRVFDYLFYATCKDVLCSILTVQGCAGRC